MSAIAIDTHVLLWYILDPSQLSQPAHDALSRAERDGAPVYVSAISLVEIRYLVEKGRIVQTALQLVENVLNQVDSPLVLMVLDFTVTQALERVSRAAVPDMPDRIIAATALHLDVPLVTRDAAIRAAPITTIW